MKILVTGGAGFIGSHMALALLGAGHHPILLDNFSNSKKGVLARLARVSGSLLCSYEGDVRDISLLEAIFKEHQIDAVIHFAALKSVSQSVLHPLRYYDNNVSGLITLLRVMHVAGCRRFIFSSSCTVYGNASKLPISEDAELGYTNPYGHTKLLGEQIVGALRISNPEWKTAILRYFNPVGAHLSGMIGEDPMGVPSNLFPYIAKVADGTIAKLMVFGSDYPTRDGTGVRDYIHVEDLVAGHLASLDALDSLGSHTLNLGTGRGYSVLEVIDAYSRASKRSIPYEVVGRRPGEAAEAVADPSLATSTLGWSCQYGLEEMCASAWRWQVLNPTGYRS